MILGIDATNIRWGGGVTHLIELLREAKPSDHGFNKVILWGWAPTLEKIEDRPWLVKANEPMLNKSLPLRIYWQKFILSKRAFKSRCSILFVPGGAYSGSFHPVVTMSRNLLPFELRELLRFGWSLVTVKLLLLRFIQSRSYRRTDGVIFLNNYAQNAVMNVVGHTTAKTTIIPHGLNFRFVSNPKPQRKISEYNKKIPFQILYVSTIDMFKHQCEVIESIALLREQSFPIVLNLVGGAYGPALRNMSAIMRMYDPKSEFIYYHGEIPYVELHEQYKRADLGLFASSCENMPNILLELMASGLPIACSNFGPMPEVLGDGGVYFNPERPLEIRDALQAMLNDPDLRQSLACKSFEKAKKYSWNLCADKTFQFLAGVAKNAS